MFNEEYLERLSARMEEIKESSKKKYGKNLIEEIIKKVENNLANGVGVAEIIDDIKKNNLNPNIDESPVYMNYDDIIQLVSAINILGSQIPRERRELSLR